MSARSGFLVFNTGCIECGVSSNVVGIYDTQKEADEVCEKCSDELSWRESGQNRYEVFDLSAPMAEEYAKVLNKEPK